jgi:hypothetical protein
MAHRSIDFVLNRTRAIATLHRWETDSKNSRTTSRRRRFASRTERSTSFRSRTGTLLAAASVVTSLVGAQALDAVGFDWAAVIALSGFGASAILSVYVLFPRRRIARSLSGPGVYEYFVSKDIGLSDARRQLAYWLDEAYVRNSRVVNRLFWSFSGACVALVIEVAFSSIALARLTP